MTSQLAPAEHQALGLELACARDDLEKVVTWLATKRLPEDRRAIRALKAAGHHLDAARFELDTMLWDDRETTGWGPLVYFPDDDARAAWRAQQAARAV